MNFSVLADAATLTTISTAMTDGLTTVVSDAMTGISNIIPVALPVMGAMILIGVAVKTVKKFTGR